jgi:hypothetical protein
VRVLLCRIRRHPHIFLYVTVFILILVYSGCRLWLLEIRCFDQDEFEHLHGAWLISKGLLPYRDYFEHHTPWLHFLLAPFYHFFDVETNVGDAFAFLFFARRLMWILTGIILLFTFLLGNLWRNARVACVGMLFLANTEVFSLKTLEIRPDVLTAVCWLVCLVIVVRAVQSEKAVYSQTQWQFAWSGTFLGAGIMATQKVLFALPGLAVAMSWYILDPRAHGTRRTRLQNVGYQVAGLCAPIFLTLVYFYLRNGLGEFFEYNFFFNFRFKGKITPFHYLPAFIYDNPYLTFLGSAGLICLLPSIFRQNSFWRGDFILIPSLLGLIGGLFLIPAPYQQYYLLFLPLLSLLAGAFLVESVDKLAALRERMHLWQWSLLVTLCSLIILTGLGLISRGAGSHWPPLLVTTYWLSAVIGTLILLVLRARTFALVFFLMVLSAAPLKRMGDVFDLRNSAQLDEIRYIVEHTAPTDTIMDGFTGSGVFRPHAYFYFFPHYGIRTMLTDEDRHELLKDLYSGRIAPKLILFDKNLQDLSPAISAFLEENYQSVGRGVIWRRQEMKILRAGDKADISE